MKDYLLDLKHIWTHWIWYAWIAFTLAVVWPVASWPLYIAATVGFSLIMPLYARVERHYRELDNKQ